MVFTLQVPDRLNVHLIWPNVRFIGLLNAILGKVGGRAPEDVILELIRSKCLPALFYGLEACPLRKSDISSLYFVINRFFMKLFQTNNIDYCCTQFEFHLPSTVVEKRIASHLLQNIVRVKMLYVNLRNLCHCCYFSFRFCVDFCCFFLFIAFYHIMLNKDVYIMYTFAG